MGAPETINMLFAPAAYWQASPEVLAVITNGCGTAGWKGELVPDSIWGLNITLACNIHDFSYTIGLTCEDKDEADSVLLNNICRLIDHAGGPWFLKTLRHNRAREYYLAVKYFGGPAFWAGKNPAENISTAKTLVLA